MKLFVCRGKGSAQYADPSRRSGISFRVQAFAATLTRQERADVASRRRFYTMPHLRRSDAPDLDAILF